MGEQIRVLHVDDDADFASMVPTALEREDTRFRVETATSTGEGLALLASDDFDCVVSDYEMPGQNGLDFLETVREEYPNLPFILLTGKGSEEVASEAISAGVTDYIQKKPEMGGYALLANRIRNAVERYHAQRAIEQSERKLSRVYERITDGFFAVNTDWHYIYVNEEGARLTGWSRDELLDERVWEAFPGLSGTPFGDALRTAMNTQKTTSVKEYYPPHDIWYDATVYPAEDGISIYFRDATDQRERERAIEDLHEVATDLAECTTREEAYQRTVDAAESLLQFDSAAVAIEEDGLLRVKTTTDGLAPVEQVTLSVDEGIAGKTYRTGESFLIPDVTAVEEAKPQTEMSSAMSMPIGEHGVFQVIDKRTDAFDERDLELAELLVRHTESALDLLDRERELERQNERLDEFASVVSHDLRNPLNVATLRLDLARTECDSEHLDDIADALERSQALLEDLRTLARDGETVRELDTLDFSTIVDACWRSVATADATCIVETDGSILADRSRLRQLLENLFRNAVDHGGDDVRVTVGELDDRAGFYVDDDGPGIPAERREQVFESGYTTSADGTGFGLAIVRRIVEAHGWDVSATETEEGGTRVEITGVEFVD